MRKPENTVINVKINKYIKQCLSDILLSHGMTISEALRLCIWQIVAQKGLPYKGFVTTKAYDKDNPHRSIEKSHDSNYELLQTKLLIAKDRLEPMVEYNQQYQKQRDEEQSAETRAKERMQEYLKYR